MAKFNQTATIKTENKSGRVAYGMTDKSKLVTQVLSSFFNESKFYGDNSREMEKTIKSVIKSDPEFVSKLAVFARREFNMRSVSHVLTAYLAHEPNGKPYVKDTVKGVTVRGDDVTEILSFYLSTFGKPIPNSLKKGINTAFAGFDEYTLAKYKGDGKAVKMRDILCLCHPTPKTKEQSEMWKRCIEGKLETPTTWETQLSKIGNTTEAWENLIASGKLGYMAILRNLRNIVSKNPKNIDKVWSTIENADRVRRSKQLPFRFLSAYKAIGESAGSRAFDALENAVDASVENIKKIPGTTVIAVDTSGSMSSFVSAKSEIRCCEIGMMLGLLANRICENSIFYTFNNDIEKQSLSKKTGILYAATHIRRVLGGTNMFLPFLKMIDDKVQADRIIIISDNECNASAFWYRNRTVQSIAEEYRKVSGNDIWVHAIDLQGYGTQQFHGNKTNIIAGWSEKVLDFITLAEQGESTLERTIENYNFKENGFADFQN